MKKFEKEIKVTRFVAFDDSEFETEEECISYEKSRFAALMQLLWERVVSYGNVPSSTPYGTRYDKYYAIVQRSRNDVFNLNQILSLAGSEDMASGTDENKLIVLCVRLECNAIVDACLVRTEELIKNLSRGQFGVVSMIKPDERKK